MTTPDVRKRKVGKKFKKGIKKGKNFANFGALCSTQTHTIKRSE